jgi:hypothetical protein
MKNLAIFWIFIAFGFLVMVVVFGDNLECHSQLLTKKFTTLLSQSRMKSLSAINNYLMW